MFALGSPLLGQLLIDQCFFCSHERSLPFTVDAFVQQGKVPGRTNSLSSLGYSLHIVLASLV